MEVSEIKDIKVGLRERNSHLMCTICEEVSVIRIGERKEVVGYLVDNGDGWEVTGLYCNECEPHGGQIKDPTDGVAEACVVLTVIHDAKEGTIIEDIEVIDKND